MASDFGGTRYCNVCEGEIVRKGDVITMYEGKKICKCNKGCRRIGNWFADMEHSCGDFEDLKHSDHIILCPECRKKFVSQGLGENDA